MAHFSDNNEVKIFKSSDAGITWEEIFKINSSLKRISGTLNYDKISDTLYYAYRDESVNPTRVLLINSADKGTTWSLPSQIDYPTGENHSFHSYIVDNKGFQYIIYTSQTYGDISPYIIRTKEPSSSTWSPPYNLSFNFSGEYPRYSVSAKTMDNGNRVITSSTGNGHFILWNWTGSSYKLTNPFNFSSEVEMLFDSSDNFHIYTKNSSGEFHLISTDRGANWNLEKINFSFPTGGFFQAYIDDSDICSILYTDDTSLRFINNNYTTPLEVNIAADNNENETTSNETIPNETTNNESETNFSEDNPKESNAKLTTNPINKTTKDTKPSLDNNDEGTPSSLKKIVLSILIISFIVVVSIMIFIIIKRNKQKP